MPSIKKFKMILNNIEEIIENPCAPSWDVIVSAAVPAAKDVIIFLIEPTLVDVLQSWAHPKFGRNRSRGRRPKYYERQETRAAEKRVVQRFGLPDINEVVAEKIPGRKFFGQRVAGPKEAWVWFGLDLLDRAQWYWLVASLTEEFIYDWTSGIMQSNFCSKKFDALWQGNRVERHGFTQERFNFWTPAEARNMQQSRNLITPTSGKTINLSYMVSYKVTQNSVTSDSVTMLLTIQDASGSHTTKLTATLQRGVEHTFFWQGSSIGFLSAFLDWQDTPGEEITESGYATFFGYTT